MSRILLAAGLAVMFPGTVLAGQFNVLHRFRDVQPSIGNNLQVDTDGSVYGTHIVPRGRADLQIPDLPHRIGRDV